MRPIPSRRFVPWLVSGSSAVPRKPVAKDEVDSRFSLDDCWPIRKVSRGVLSENGGVGGEVEKGRTGLTGSLVLVESLGNIAGPVIESLGFRCDGIVDVVAGKGGMVGLFDVGVLDISRTVLKHVEIFLGKFVSITESHVSGDRDREVTTANTRLSSCWHCVP